MMKFGNRKRRTLNAQRPMIKAAVGARGYNYSCSFVLISG
jgi:hypothetical protein